MFDVVRLHVFEHFSASTAHGEHDSLSWCKERETRSTSRVKQSDRMTLEGGHGLHLNCGHVILEAVTPTSRFLIQFWETNQERATPMNPDFKLTLNPNVFTSNSF
jgi:hypothetical protein